MKKLFLFALAALAGIVPAAAEGLTAEQALARALKTDGPAKVRALKPAQLKLAYTAKDAAFYAFNRADNDGFIIASGDTRMRPVLGVSDSGAFDETNPALAEWLDFYSQEANALKKDDKDDDDAINQYDNYALWQPIAPLIQTQWNQTPPYNIKTPTFGNDHAPTGCVATAVAQIVRYYQYYQGKGKTDNYDFTQWTPDFSKMPATINGNSPQEQINEISELMIACGRAVNTGYHKYSAGAGDPVSGVVSHLGYDAASVTYTRTNFNTPQWEKLVYDQIASGRPVYYTGTGSTGHAFICDGYSSNGLFHFNWGWGGDSDGYFVLSSLHPRNQGTGSGEGGYNNQQYICLFVTPGADKPNADAYITHPVELVNLTALSVPTTTGTKDFFTVRYGIYKTALKGSFGFAPTIVLKNIDGQSDEIVMNPEEYLTLKNLDLIDNFTVDFAKTRVPAGEYDAWFVGLVSDYDGYCNSYYQAQSGARAANDHWRIKIAQNGSRTYSMTAVSGHGIEIAETSTNDLYANDAANALNFTLTNSGNQDWIEQIKLQILGANGNVVSQSEACFPFVPARGYTELTFPAEVAAGKYTAKLVRPQYEGSPALSDKVLTFEVKSGKRPDDAKTDKGITPVTSTEVAIWVGAGQEPQTLSRTVIATGQPITGTTALKGIYGSTFGYSLAIAPYDDPFNPVEVLPIISNVAVTPNQWIEGQQFSVTPTVGPGKYKIYFCDQYNIAASYAADLIVGLESNGNFFQLLDGDALALVAPAAGAASLVVPASVNYNGKSYPVTTIATEAAALNRTIASLTVPASVTSIEKDAFRGCSNLREITFECKSVPFANAILAFCGVNNSMIVNVPDGTYGDYRKAMPECWKIYVELTSFDVPAELTMMAGHVMEFTPITNTPYYDPELFQITCPDSRVLQVEYNENGRVSLRAVATGEATLKVTCLKPAGEKSVKVTVVNEVNISLDQSKLDLQIGENAQLKATLSDPKSTLKITWATSDPDVATVDGNGLVTAKLAGSAVISVYVEGNEVPATCSVKVTSTVSSIKFEPKSMTLALGEWGKFTPVITPESASNIELEWTSSNVSIANVSKDGDVYAAGVGKCIIRATVTDGSNLSASAVVQVTEKDGILEVEIEEGSARIYDIQGRRVQNPSRGLYIVNGKLMLKK